MTDSMLERVARAQWEARRQYAAKEGIQLEPWGDGRLPAENGIWGEARAALQALREPTEHMLDIGSCHEDPEERYGGEVELGIKSQGDIARDVWQAMIDAALSEDTR